MHAPLAPEPGDGRYFLVGILAVVVVILGIVVINHPGVGPGRTINSLFGWHASPASGEPLAP